MANPLFKWPGGKRWLASKLAQLGDFSTSRLIEPFAGGSALFFYVEPKSAVLGDLNPAVINCYRHVRNDLASLEFILDQFHNSEEDYYKIRSWIPKASIEEAARFLYLTRLSFNGIYRENRNGTFNVPYGHKSHLAVFDRDHLRQCSRLLLNADLRNLDFEACVHDAAPGDFVYLDPPYTVAHNSNGFIKYNADVFSWVDQRRLAEVGHHLVRTGCKVVVSNAHHESIQKLYPEFRHVSVPRWSVVGSRSGYRKQILESLFISPGVEE